MQSDHTAYLHLELLRSRESWQQEDLRLKNELSGRNEIIMQAWGQQAIQYSSNTWTIFERYLGTWTALVFEHVPMLWFWPCTVFLHRVRYYWTPMIAAFEGGAVAIQTVNVFRKNTHDELLTCILSRKTRPIMAISYKAHRCTWFWDTKVMLLAVELIKEWIQACCDVPSPLHNIAHFWATLNKDVSICIGYSIRAENGYGALLWCKSLIDETYSLATLDRSISHLESQVDKLIWESQVFQVSYSS